jgi:hypothetical protein
MQRIAWWLSAVVLLAAGSARADDVKLVSVTEAEAFDPSEPIAAVQPSPSDIVPPGPMPSPAKFSEGLCDGTAAKDGDGDCDWCNGQCVGRSYVELEATYFRYHRADGLRVGSDALADDINPGRFFAAPRFTVGYISAGGLGIRGRFWHFNQVLNPNEGAPSALAVDTYNVDLELFERFNVNGPWDFEVFGGVRYNSFDENMDDMVGGENEHRRVGFQGFGLIGGMEARRQMQRGAIYGRARFGILMDDKSLINSGSGTQQLFDTALGVTEIAMGYEWSRPTARGSWVWARFGVEYQQWQNFSSNFTAGTASPEAFWTGASDVGFAGFTASVGWMR